MPAWLHPLVQDADDFGQSWPDRPVIKHVDGPPHACTTIVLSQMSNMKAAQARRKLGALSRRPTLRFGCYLADGARQQPRIPASGFNAPVLRARNQNARDVRLGTARQAKARHRSQRGPFSPTPPSPSM